MNKNKWISDKIGILIKEGKPREQAVAIAYSMWERGDHMQQGGFKYDRSFNTQGIPYTSVNPSLTTSSFEMYNNYANQLGEALPQAPILATGQFNPNNLNSLQSNFKDQYSAENITKQAVKGVMESDVTPAVDNTQYNDWVKYNILNPYGQGMDLNTSLAYTGQQFGQGNTGMGIAGAGLSALKGVRSFLSGYGSGRGQQNVERQMRDKLYNSDENLYQQGGSTSVANNRPYGEGALNNWWNSLDFEDKEQQNIQKDFNFINDWYRGRKFILDKNGKKIAVPKTTIQDFPNVSKELLKANVLGVYTPSQNTLKLDQNFMDVEGIYGHELNHKYQDSMNKQKYVNEPIYNSMSKETKTKYFEGTEDDRYRYTPEEIHSRLMQFRQKNNIKPNQIIKKSDLSNFIDRDTFDLDKLKDEELINMLNRSVDVYKDTPNLQYSQEGGISRYKDVPYSYAQEGLGEEQDLYGQTASNNYADLIQQAELQGIAEGADKIYDGLSNQGQGLFNGEPVAGRALYQPPMSPNGESTFVPTTVEKTDSNSARDIWTEKTGLPWSEAKRLGYTDGSAKDNTKLLQELNDPRFKKENLRTKPFTAPVAQAKAQVKSAKEAVEAYKKTQKPAQKPINPSDDYHYNWVEDRHKNDYLDTRTRSQKIKDALNNQLKTFGYELAFQQGGYSEGQEYDLTEEEIHDLLSKGYKIRYK